MNFQLNVIDAQREIYKGEASKIVLSGIDGVMAVRARHMPYVTPLGVGEVSYWTDKGEEINLSIGRGILAVETNKVTVIVEDTRYGEEISQEKAAEAKERAEEIIKKGVKGVELTRALQSIRRSLVDIKIARKSRKKFVS